MEMEGSIFCRECGGQLLLDQSFDSSKTNRTTDYRSNDTAEQMIDFDFPSPVVLEPGALVTLNLVGKGAFFSMEEEGEMILGRGSEGQSMIPDFDLNPYDAFKAGVSRIHAAIRVVEDQVIITDLGSSNGTSINGEKIEPHVPHSLRSGDILSLGRFKIEVVTRY
jgi:hypothetical protein